jgi:7-keto-8-aminopelargonate synthetase-like enzyme
MKQNNSPFKYILDGPTGALTHIENMDMLYFAGVGYFQLQNHPELIEASVGALKKYGIGTATSRAGIGTTDLLLELDQSIADFFDTEDAVYLPSGYLSNIAGVQALKKMQLFDVIFIDEVVHYCNEEASMVAGVPVHTFKSRDAADLEVQIKKHLKASQKPLIMSDGLFPVWAYMAPVPEYLKIAEKYNGVIWVDDAHPVGIIGENGRGTYDYFGLKSGRLYMGATLSKAFGAYGGIVPGTQEFIYHVKNGNIINGSTSPVSGTAAAALKGIELVAKNPQWRKELQANAVTLKNGLRSLGIAVEENNFPITSFKLGNGKQMQHIHEKLMQRGIYIQYTKYIGAGPEGVLRTVVFSTHTSDQVQQLISTLKEII